MMRRMDAGRFHFLVASILVFAAGCAAPEEGPLDGGTITLALRDSFETFDPALAWDPEQGPFLRLIYEGLVAFDDSGRVVPACARAWQVVDAGHTVRFELAKGLRAADGAPVTAHDFRRGFERLFRTGALRSPGAPQFVALVGALDAGTRRAPPLGIEVPDDRTLVLRLAWPDPFLLEKLAQPRWVAPVSESGQVRPNGSYRMARAGGGYLFTRDTDYLASLADEDPRRGRAGALDTVRVLTGIPARRAVLGLESGRIDLLWPVPIEYRDRLLHDGGFSHHEASLDPPLGWWLVMNAELAPLARRDARRGMAQAILRPRLTEELGPWVQPQRSFAAEGLGEAPGYDPGAARLSFEAARYFTGVRIPITVPRAGALAAGVDALAPALARGAVQVEALMLPRSRWSQAVLSRRGFQAALVPWQAATRDGLDDLAARLLNRGLRSGWGGNWSGYHPGAALDSLLLRGLRESDPAARASLREQVEQLLESDLPFVPLVTVRDAVVFRPELTGVEFRPREGLDFRAIRRRNRAAMP